MDPRSRGRPRATPPPGPYQHGTRLTIVTHTFLSWIAYDYTAASSNFNDDTVREAECRKTAVIRPVEIPYPEGSRGPVLSQGAQQPLVKTLRGQPRPKQTTARSSSCSPSSNNSRPSPHPPRALGGLGPIPQPVLTLPPWVRNSPRTRPPPTSQPHQFPLETEITFQTSPH